MAATNENPSDRATAEKIVSVLTAHFPQKSFGVLYLPRRNILEMDQHQVIQRRTVLGIPLPLVFGEVLCQYCGGDDCFVHKDSILALVQTIVPAATMHPDKMLPTAVR